MDGTTASEVTGYLRVAMGLRLHATTDPFATQAFRRAKLDRQTMRMPPAEGEEVPDPSHIRKRCKHSQTAAAIAIGPHIQSAETLSKALMTHNAHCLICHAGLYHKDEPADDYKQRIKEHPLCVDCQACDSATRHVVADDANRHIDECVRDNNPEDARVIADEFLPRHESATALSTVGKTCASCGYVVAALFPRDGQMAVCLGCAAGELQVAPATLVGRLVWFSTPWSVSHGWNGNFLAARVSCATVTLHTEESSGEVLFIDDRTRRMSGIPVFWPTNMCSLCYMGSFVTAIVQHAIQHDLRIVAENRDGVPTFRLAKPNADGDHTMHGAVATLQREAAAEIEAPPGAMDCD